MFGDIQAKRDGPWEVLWSIQLAFILALVIYLLILYLLKPKQEIIKNVDLSNQISLCKILSCSSINLTG
jgi:hypothetical protein